MKDTLAFHIAALYRDFLACTTGELKKLGLSFGQMPMILYIGKHPGCTQADLTRSLRLDWGYSQRSTAKLVESGFILKEYDQKKSGNCLQLTEAGKNAFKACHDVFYSWDQMHAGNLTAEEREILISLLSRLTAERKESC